MDIISAILIIAPLIVPIAVALDIDAIHLGIVFIVNLEIGYLTPPLGLNLFVATTLFGKPLGDVIRAVLPFTLAILVGVLMITYIPAIALGPGEILKDMRGETTEETNVQSIQEIMKALKRRMPLTRLRQRSRRLRHLNQVKKAYLEKPMKLPRREPTVIRLRWMRRSQCLIPMRVLRSSHRRTSVSA